MRLLPRVHRFRLFFPCGAPPPNPTLALFPVNGNGRRAKEEAEEDGSTDFRPACPGEDPERKPPPPFLFLSPFAISFGRVANIVRWLQRSSGQEGVRFSVSRRKRDKKREGGGGEETEERDRGGGEVVSVRWLLPLLDNSPFFAPLSPSSSSSSSSPLPRI